MAPQAQPAEQQSSPSRKRLLVMVVAILVIEAVLIVGAMKLLGGPAPAHANEAPADPADTEAEQVVELQVLDDSLANSRSGATYLYDTEIYVQVRKKHADRVQAYLEQFRNEIKAEITAIWRTSEPQHFQEPKLDNLTRKLQSMLGDRLGPDPAGGEPIIIKCVVVMQTGFRIDG
jgi:hypothetical protein